jgi:hypothetical protein
MSVFICEYVSASDGPCEHGKENSCFTKSRIRDYINEVQFLNG